jgi:hypothetical protein
VERERRGGGEDESANRRRVRSEPPLLFGKHAERKHPAPGKNLDTRSDASTRNSFNSSSTSGVHWNWSTVMKS